MVRSRSKPAPPRPERRVPSWVFACIALVALAQLGLGTAMLLWSAHDPFVSVNGERLAWQAIGVLQAVVGAALCLPLSRPFRHGSVIGLGLAAKLCGIAALLIAVVVSGADIKASSLLAGVELLLAVLLAAPMRTLASTPEVAPAPSQVRPVSTTTLFGLQQTLQSLAAPASIQLAMFPDLVGNPERVMGDFRAWRERALLRRDSMSPQQEDVLRGLDECLHRMLEQGSAELWTEQAVRQSVEWGQLRAAARRALVAFSWSVDMPIAVLRREPRPSIDLSPPT